MKADYKNWMPKGMVLGMLDGALTIACAKRNPTLRYPWARQPPIMRKL